MNKKESRERLAALQTEERTMLFHEAPHKLRATLADLRDAFDPDRRLSLCRELTKLHEETLRMTLGEAVAYYEVTEPKGEFVLVLEGAPQREKAGISLEEAAAMVLRRREEGEKLKDAVKEVAQHTDLPRNELYAAALRLSEEG